MRFGLNHILEDISLDIAKGERISLVGPNGSGKTTLLRIILGIERADAGGVSLHRLEDQVVSYVPQDYRNALFPWLRLSTNLTLANGGPPPPASTSSRTLVDQLREYHSLADMYRLSLDLSKYPYQLSGGEQQIFLLLRAILSKPFLMLLDEPLAAVDFGRKRLILGHLGKWIPETQTTVVFASHDFEEAVMLADRVIVFERESGKLKTIVPVDLPWPRTLEMRTRTEFRYYVETIIGAIT
jgi:NitT/TauT family transport system ATP-binding protein